MQARTFTAKSAFPSRASLVRDLLRMPGGDAGRLAGIAKNVDRPATKHCQRRWQPLALALRRLGGLRGLHRWACGHRVVPGRELGCGVAPVGPVTPVVV